MRSTLYARPPQSPSVPLAYYPDAEPHPTGTPTVLNEKQPVPPKDFVWIDPTGGDRVNSYLRFKVSSPVSQLVS